MKSTKLRILQTLFNIYAAHSLDVASSDRRAERLSWASRNLGREVSSFSDLSERDADLLIDTLKELTGQNATPKQSWSRPRDRYLAQAFGTHGRAGRGGTDEVIAAPGDLAAIDNMRERLGWSRQEFEAWLAGPRSPIASGRALRTMSDCNRVRWALKAILKKAGLWYEPAKRSTNSAA